MLLKPEIMHLLKPFHELKPLFHEQQLTKNFSQSNVIFSVFLVFPKFHSAHEPILQIFNPVILALNIDQT